MSILGLPSKPSNLKFREDFDTHQVVVSVGRRELFRHSEYKCAAEWAKAQFKLTDAELISLYQSYKLDYERRLK